MAKELKPTRILRTNSETVREKVEKTTAASAEAKPRRLHANTRKVTAPLGKGASVIGRFLGKISKYIIPPYFRNSWKELKQVTWPTRHETFRLVCAVIAFSIVFGVSIFVIDLGLDKLFKEVLVK